MERGLDKFLKYEQTFYGDIICIFQESSSITLLSLSVIIISVCTHIDAELDFDLICCRTTTKFMPFMNITYAWQCSNFGGGLNRERAYKLFLLQRELNGEWGLLERGT